MHQLLVALVFTVVAIGVTTVNAKSPFVFSLDESSARMVRQSGNMTLATVKEFPILKRLSMRHLTLASSGIREPHWHVNANELVYCLRGMALVTIFGNHGEHATFSVKQGEMFYVPSGFIHHIENMMDDSTGMSSVAEFIHAFSHELPEDIGLSSAFGAMSDAVLGNTFQLPSSAWKEMTRHTEPTVIGTRERSTNIRMQPMDQYPNKFKFDIESMPPMISMTEGSVKMATKPFWPVLRNLSMLTLRISTTGMREPHWHPETCEMGYVVQGQARMKILAPGNDQRMEMYTLKQGDVYFVPRGYLHVIENIGNEETMFLVFFDKPTPEDIGFTGTFSAFSREVLAATLQCPMSKMPNFPFYSKDMFIVKRSNPID
jgi:oxalate decarboxylase